MSHDEKIFKEAEETLCTWNATLILENMQKKFILR